MNCIKKLRLDCRFVSAGNSFKSKMSTIPKVESDEPIRSTVDSDEIFLHGGLRSQWWKRDGPMKPLHSLNKLRVPLVRDGLLDTCDRFKNNKDTPFPLKGAKILEVGCGGGILSEPLARIGAEMVGIDASEDLINLAKEHALNNSITNLNYINDTIENFSQQHFEEFDAVITSEVVEHVSEKDLFIKSCVHTLRPGGSLFITTINKTRLSWILGVVMAENVLELLPKGTHHWDKFISPEELSRISNKHNCKTKLVHGMAYVPWNNEWCWTSSTPINYAAQYIKCA